MDSNYRDQADGLRRLFDSGVPRIIAFAAGKPDVGKSVLITNIAYAMAMQGKQVLLLDESSDNRLASCFGLKAMFDLNDVINREKTLSSTFIDVMTGLRILPIAQMVKRLGTLSIEQKKVLIEIFSGLNPAPDFILVNTSPDHPLGFSPFGLAADSAVIAMTLSGTSITETYALIKKVSLAYSKRDFKILVNRAKNFDEAVSIFGNLAEVTHKKRIAQLEYAGFIPTDEGLRQASRLCQPVAGIFPDAPSIDAFNRLAKDINDWPVQENNARGIEYFVQHLLNLGQSIDPVAIYA